MTNESCIGLQQEENDPFYRCLKDFDGAGHWLKLSRTGFWIYLEKNEGPPKEVVYKVVWEDCASTVQ